MFVVYNILFASVLTLTTVAELQIGPEQLENYVLGGIGQLIYASVLDKGCDFNVGLKRHFGTSLVVSFLPQQ